MLAMYPTLGPMERRLCRQPRRRGDSDEVSYCRQAGECDGDCQTDERHLCVEDSERPGREERTVDRATGQQIWQ